MDVDGRPALSSSDRVGISRSFRTHFAVVKHCPHIVLKIFYGFQLLVHLQTTKKRITPRCSSLLHTESGAAILLCHSATLNCVMMLKLPTRRQRCYLLACAQKAVPPTHRTLKHQCRYFLTNLRTLRCGGGDVSRCTSRPAQAVTVSSL